MRAGPLVYLTFFRGKKLRFYSQIGITRLDMHLLMRIIPLKHFITFRPDIVGNLFDVSFDDGHELMPSDDFGVRLDQKWLTSSSKFII
jgi:hypothetical protein